MIGTVNLQEVAGREGGNPPEHLLIDEAVLIFVDVGPHVARVSTTRVEVTIVFQKHVYVVKYSAVKLEQLVSQLETDVHHGSLVEYYRKLLRGRREEIDCMYLLWMSDR